MVTVTVISVGFYGFGMSLNDIIDRRRDRDVAWPAAAHGRVGLATAHVICILLAVAAVVAGSSSVATARPLRAAATPA